MMFSRILAVILVLAATLWIGSGVLGRTERRPQPPGRRGQRAARSPCSRSPCVTAGPTAFARALAFRPHRGRQPRERDRAHHRLDRRASRSAAAAWSVGDVLAVLSDEAREAQVAEAEAHGPQAPRPTSTPSCSSSSAASWRRTSRPARSRSPLPRRRSRWPRPNASAASIRAPITGRRQRRAGDRRPGGPAQRHCGGGHRARPDACRRRGRRAPAWRHQARRPAMVRLVTGADGGGDRPLRLADRQQADPHLPGRGRARQRRSRDLRRRHRRGRLPADAVAAPACRAPPSPSRPRVTQRADRRSDGMVASVPVTIIEDARDEVWLSGPTTATQSSCRARTS